MTLSEYLTFYPGAARQIATAVGVSRSTVWRWQHGHVFPSPRAIQEIEYVTGGAVRPQDWYTSTEGRP